MIRCTIDEYIDGSDDTEPIGTGFPFNTLPSKGDILWLFCDTLDKKDNRVDVTVVYSAQWCSNCLRGETDSVNANKGYLIVKRIRHDKKEES